MMEKKYQHQEYEPEMFRLWEESGAFSPEGAFRLRKKYSLPLKEETFCVLIPPPNANAPLHLGHATYAIQDLMTRYKRMQGYKTLYLPGTDHAGFETQVVYERNLKKEGKSRFDFDAQTLYRQILEFVLENSSLAVSQLKRLGMSADWQRNTFTLDEKVLQTVTNTFKKMHQDGLIYRDVYLVNYSPYYGTTFSNLETEHKETVSPLYYVSYQVKDSTEKITVATVRPETIYADVAIAVNPKDKRYENFLGKTVLNPLNGRKMKVISDSYVDLEFGTGALKITPGHDFNDFEIGRKNKLPMISVIDLEGKMTKEAGEVAGMTVMAARQKTAEILKAKGSLVKIDEKYTNNLLVDYKDGKPIEPLLLPNWFIKMDKLSAEAIRAVKEKKVKFNREVWKKEMLRWLENITDWPISRQIVFGIRIPAWYSVKENPDLFVTFLDQEGHSYEGEIGKLLKDHSLEEIKKGLQKIIAPIKAKFVIERTSPGDDYLQETNTFDTWFSSGQWPMVTLNYPNGKDFEEFFPTSFMDSMWDILFFWIARMIIFSLYLTGEIPFKNVYIHGRVSDERGQKMSKSRGNVINPLDYIEKYGADALRMGILVGGNTAAKNTSLSEDKIRGYRNFANKIWNMARFMSLMFEDFEGEVDLEAKNKKDKLTKEDKKILRELGELIKKVTAKMDHFKFMEAGDEIYHFLWHKLADEYLESIKGREDKEISLGVLYHAFTTCLKLLHPFMPFVTEKIWQSLPGDRELLIVSNWPEVK
jgi:valyl-tRNA synthetase